MEVAGLLHLMVPGLTLIILVQFLGLYWLVDGVVRLVSIFVDWSGWGWKLRAGILGIAAGLVVVQHSLWSALTVPGAIAFYLPSPSPPDRSVTPECLLAVASWVFVAHT